MEDGRQTSYEPHNQATSQWYSSNTFGRSSVLETRTAEWDYLRVVHRNIGRVISMLSPQLIIAPAGAKSVGLYPFNETRIHVRVIVLAAMKIASHVTRATGLFSFPCSAHSLPLKCFCLFDRS